MLKQLKSIEDFKGLKIGDEIQIHTISKILLGKIIDKHDEGNFEAEVENFDEVIFNVEKILSGKSQTKAIYLLS